MAVNLPAILSDLKDITDYKRRIRAAQMLGQTNHTDALPALILALKDSYFLVRKAAAISLGAYNSTDIVPSLVAALTDVPCVREAAIASLAQLEDKGVAAAEIALEKERLERTLKREFESMMYVDTLTQPSQLLEALNDSRFTVRKRAATKLATASSSNALSPLLKALDDPYLAVREAAYASLTSYKGPLSLSILMDALLSDHGLAQKAAAELLHNSEDPQVIEALTLTLHDPSYNVRQRVCALLAHLGDDHPLHLLLTALYAWDSPIHEIPAYLIVSFYLQKRMEAVALLHTAVNSLRGDPLLQHFKTGIDALDKLADHGEWRHLSYFADFNAFPYQSEMNAALKKASRLQPDNTLLCTTHGTRFIPVAKPGVAYQVCRTCKQTHRSIEASKTIAVFDENMVAPAILQDSEYRISWLHRRSLFDFDAIEIGPCSVDDLMIFCIDAGNDTDSFRLRRYNQTPVFIRDSATIPTPLRKLLEKQFQVQ